MYQNPKTNSLKKDWLVSTKMKDLMKKDIVLNKDINKLIDSKNKKTENIEISLSTRLRYICCCYKENISKKGNTNEIFKLIQKIDNYLDKACDF